MTAPTLDFYFDFLSPYAYLASAVLPRITAQHGATIRLRPFGLVELMARVGNRPTTLECKNKGRYVTQDLGRWSRRCGLPLSANPHWTSFDFAELGRGALVAIDEGHGPAYVAAIFHAVFGAPRDLSRREVLHDVLERAGLSADVLRRAASPEWCASYARGTEEAADRGVFGAPAMFVGEEMFFGNDRLDFVADALRRCPRDLAE